MMRMSDMMSRIGATFFVEVALVLFFAVFVGVFVYAFVMLSKDSVDRYAAMPLEDDKILPNSSETQEQTSRI